MATFYSVLSFIAVNSFQYSESGAFDIISSLPMEMAITVLRMLSGRDLLNAACANKKWFHICQSDNNLRRKIRRYIRQHRRALISTRILAVSGRNRTSHTSNRPAMTNVLNTANRTNSHVYRPAPVPASTRYMPYHRDLPFGLTSGPSFRRRSSNTGESAVSRPRLRM